MEYKIFDEMPKDFKPTLEVASCYCAYEDKILLLKRHPNKSQGNTWGVPAGKMEKGETPRMGIIREVREEIGVNINDKDLIEIGKRYIRLPQIDFVYHMFRKKFLTKPTIKLALDEHSEAVWVTVAEAMKMPLIAGGDEALTYYTNILKKLQ